MPTDTERIDWMGTQRVLVLVPGEESAGFSSTAKTGEVCAFSRSTLREAIDAAIEAEQQPPADPE